MNTTPTNLLEIQSVNVREAQLRNARIYRRWASRAPHNSSTRREWLALATAAENAAGAAPRRPWFSAKGGLC